MREQKLRKLLCKKCLAKLRQYEKEYREKNRLKIRERRRKYYLEKEKKQNTGILSDETKEMLRSRIDNMANKED